MVIVAITDGLGNQMFQYATAKALALSKGSELLIDANWFNETTHQYSGRKFFLDKFNINLMYASEGDIKRFLNPKYPFLLNSLYWRSQNILPYFKRDVFKEQSCVFDNNLFRTSENVYLKGFFQSEKYFRNIRNVLLQEFFVTEELNSTYLEHLESIENSNSVCLSVRRGDYLNQVNIKFFNILGFDYYNKAIEYISNTIENPRFFIFADDMDWLNENLKYFNCKHLEVVGSSMNNPVMGIRLMKSCKHFIMANSTYSWWGAWLSENKNKIVISPKNWYVTDRLITKDLIPEVWIQL